MLLPYHSIWRLCLSRPVLPQWGPPLTLALIFPKCQRTLATTEDKTIRGTREAVATTAVMSEGQITVAAADAGVDVAPVVAAMQGRNGAVRLLPIMSLKDEGTAVIRDRPSRTVPTPPKSIIIGTFVIRAGSMWRMVTTRKLATSIGVSQTTTRHSPGRMRNRSSRKDVTLAPRGCTRQCYRKLDG